MASTDRNSSTSQPLDSDSDSDLPPNPNHNHSSSQTSLPTLSITTFSHRLGPLSPPPSLLFDMRTLPNPPRDLRTKQTGLSKAIQDWLQHNSEFQARLEDAHRRVLEVLSKGEEGEVRVGVKCEMGRHRSVAFGECLGRMAFEGWVVEVGHRDVEKKERGGKSGREKGRRRGGDSH